MSKSQRLLQEALELSPRTRGRLAASLIESLDDQVDSDAEASWAEEIDRRLDALDSGRAKTVPWRKVEQGLVTRRRAHGR